MNVLVALLDENHTHNAAAETWLAGNIHHGWASCPLTQNGCVRILSQPAYPNALSVADAVMRLRTAISGPYHRFLADSENGQAVPEPARRRVAFVGVVRGRAAVELPRRPTERPLIRRPS